MFFKPAKESRDRIREPGTSALLIAAQLRKPAARKAFDKIVREMNPQWRFSQDDVFFLSANIQYEDVQTGKKSHLGPNFSKGMDLDGLVLAKLKLMIDRAKEGSVIFHVTHPEKNIDTKETGGGERPKKSQYTYDKETGSFTVYTPGENGVAPVTLVYTDPEEIRSQLKTDMARGSFDRLNKTFNGISWRVERSAGKIVIDTNLRYRARNDAVLDEFQRSAGAQTLDSCLHAFQKQILGNEMKDNIIVVAGKDGGVTEYARASIRGPWAALPKIVV